MPRYFLKPIVWNTNGYKRPSGARFNSGYPKETGFGWEEWNAADDSSIEEDGTKYHLFHTQSLSNFPVSQYPSDIFLFMIASHSGRQYLIGIAGACTVLSDQETKALRRQDRWRQAWALPSVKACFRGDQQAFLKRWEQEGGWCPYWKCPERMFLWLADPCLLNPSEITGRKRLVGMYGKHHEIDAQAAAKLISLIPDTDRRSVVARLKESIGCPELELETDLAEVRTRPSLNETTREALIQARRGQGKFRSEVEVLWSGRCSVTGCDVRQALRASHIKRWRNSSNRERLDPYNGFLLVATLDALFDCGLISFDDAGNMLIGETLAGLSRTEREELGLGKPLRHPPSAKHIKYLSRHREEWRFS